MAQRKNTVNFAPIVSSLEKDVAVLKEVCTALAQAQKVDLKEKFPALFSDSPKPAPKKREGLVPQGETLSLEYGSNYDGKGLLHFIGTNGGKKEWTNPHDSKKVAVSASTLMKGNVREFVDKKFASQVLFTSNIPQSWIALDFKELRIRPTIYTVSHRAKMNKFFLRSWSLQGSNDGDKWDPLCRHENDQTLCEGRQTASFHVPDCKRSYRMLRLVIQPNGNSDNTSALVASCFEVYGDVTSA